MRKAGKLLVCIVVYFISLFLIINSQCFVQLILGNYPVAGDYYICLYQSNDKQSINVKEYYQQNIYDGPINLENLYVWNNRIGFGLYVPKDIIYNDKSIRLFLLSNGYATIVNEDDASVEELNAQKKAIASRSGYWENDNSQKSLTKTNKSFKMSFLLSLKKIMSFIESSLFSIFKWIVVSVIGLGAILGAIWKFLASRRIDTILMGDPNSGKTTIAYRWKNPSISVAKLKIITSTKEREEIKLERIPYGKKDIYPRIIDSPGRSIGEMFDEINKWSEHKVILFVLAYNKDKYELERRVSKAMTQLKIIKTSKLYYEKVEKIILFINKADDYIADEEEFLNHEEEFKHIISSTKDYSDLQEQIDVIVCGSALQGWNIEELKREITKI